MHIYGSLPPPPPPGGGGGTRLMPILALSHITKAYLTLMCMSVWKEWFMSVMFCFKLYSVIKMYVSCMVFSDFCTSFWMSKLNYNYMSTENNAYPCITVSLWCGGSCSRLVISGSWIRIPLGAYALRQWMLSTIVSLNPGVVNGYPAGIYSLKCLWAPIGSSAKGRGNNMLVMM